MATKHDNIAVNKWLEDVHGDMLTKIAKREHKGCRTTEVDDVIQEVRKGFYSRSRGTDFMLWDTDGIADLAIKIAREYVGRERIDYMHFSCNYLYTPAMVEQYLREGVWWEVEDVPDVDGRIDVAREFKTLPLATRRLIFAKFALGEKGFSDAARMAITRGIDKITERLNISAQMRRLELADVE